MQPHPDSNPAVAYQSLHTTEKYANDHLDIYSKFTAGVLQARMFSFVSLVRCLGLDQSAANALYQRRNLSVLMVPIHGHSTRPMRGFHREHLDLVHTIMTTPGARPDTKVMQTLESYKEAATVHLRTTFVHETACYTIASMAEQLGLSVTAVRARLKAAGFLEKGIAQDVRPKGSSGRPQKVWPERLGEQLTALFTGKAKAMPLDAVAAAPKPLLLEHSAGHSDAAMPEMQVALEAVSAREPVEPVQHEELPAETNRTKVYTHVAAMPTLDHLWERVPDAKPEDDEAQHAMRTWRWFVTRSDAYDTGVPSDPGAPDFLDVMRACFVKNEVARVERKHAKYKSDMARLKKELDAAYRMKSVDGLETAQRLQGEMSALAAPEPVPDVDHFMAVVSRCQSLMKYTYDRAYGPEADIVVLIAAKHTDLGAEAVEENLYTPPLVAAKSMLGDDPSAEDIQATRLNMRRMEFEGKPAYTQAEIEQALSEATNGKSRPKALDYVDDINATLANLNL